MQPSMPAARRGRLGSGPHMFVQLALAAALAGPAAAPAEAAPRTVLVVSEARGFVHDSIPAARAALHRLEGAEIAVRDVAARDLTAARLRGADAVVFAVTTGDLPVDRPALRRFVRRGGGLAGFHSATDTFASWPAWERLIGGRFDHHEEPGAVETARVADPGHPAVRGVPATFRMREEWYLHEPGVARRARVLVRWGAGAPAARLDPQPRARTRLLRRARPLPGDVDGPAPGGPGAVRPALGAAQAAASTRRISASAARPTSSWRSSGSRVPTRRWISNPGRLSARAVRVSALRSHQANTSTAAAVEASATAPPASGPGARPRAAAAASRRGWRRASAPRGASRSARAPWSRRGRPRRRPRRRRSPCARRRGRRPARRRGGRTAPGGTRSRPPRPRRTPRARAGAAACRRATRPPPRRARSDPGTAA